MKTLLISATIALSFIVSPHVQAEKLSKFLTTIELPQPIKRVNPKYPQAAARNGREGWAKLSFVIEKDGSVSDVLVLETSGSRDFAKVSRKAIKQWKYEPAFENGEPIQQCVNSIQMDFRMGTQQLGVTARFLQKYNKAKDALGNKDYKLTAELLAEMAGMKNRHLSENNYMHLLAANYAKAIKDSELELFHLNRISLFALSDKLALSVLSSKMALEIASSNFHGAFATYEKLTELEVARPHMAYFDGLIEKVDQLIASENNLVINAKMKDNDYWYHTLVRNEFSLTNVAGRLTKLDVRCANKRHVYTAVENNIWKIPSTWKNCGVYVYGEDDTTFDLVELPFAS